MYTPVNLFYYIKVGFKGVKIISECFRDVLLGGMQNVDVRNMDTPPLYSYEKLPGEL